MDSDTRPVPAPSEPTPVAKQLEQQVLAVPGVVSLHGGAFGEVASYLPGERVSGIRIHDDETEIHIVTSLDHDIRDTAAAVRDVAQSVVGTPVTVFVEDVVGT